MYERVSKVSIDLRMKTASSYLVHLNDSLSCFFNFSALEAIAAVSGTGTGTGSDSD